MIATAAAERNVVSQPNVSAITGTDKPANAAAVGTPDCLIPNSRPCRLPEPSTASARFADGVTERLGRATHDQERRQLPPRTSEVPHSEESRGAERGACSHAGRPTAPLDEAAQRDGSTERGNERYSYRGAELKRAEAEVALELHGEAGGQEGRQLGDDKRRDGEGAKRRDDSEDRLESRARPSGREPPGRVNTARSRPPSDGRGCGTSTAGGQRSGTARPPIAPDRATPGGGMPPGTRG